MRPSLGMSSNEISPQPQPEANSPPLAGKVDRGFAKAMRLRSRVRADQLGLRTAEQAGVARRASRTMGCSVRAARNRRRELVSARPGRVAGANRSARRTAHSRGDRCGRRCFSSGRQPRPSRLFGRDGARHRWLSTRREPTTHRCSRQCQLCASRPSCLASIAQVRPVARSRRLSLPRHRRGS